MPSELYIVDAFTDKPFSGNQAGVCFVDTGDFQDEGFMQNVAAELNLSETAFILPVGTGNYKIRFFTPAVEIDLCGHATLASAHILYSEELVESDKEIVFDTKAGPVKVEKSSDVNLSMDLPLDIFNKSSDDDVSLCNALRIKSGFMGRGKYDSIVEVGTVDELKELEPDFEALKKIDTRIVIVTAKYDDKLNFDYACRVFCPGIGIDEDPATGAVQPLLASFWSGKLDKSDFYVHQISKRGGKLNVALKSDCVTVSGRAVTVVRGDLL